MMAIERLFRYDNDMKTHTEREEKTEETNGKWEKEETEWK